MPYCDKINISEGIVLINQMLQKSAIFVTIDMQ